MPISFPSVSSIRAPEHVKPIETLTPATQTADTAATSGASFHSVFQGAIDSVNRAQNTSTASIDRFLNGEGEDLHRVALEQQRASIAFDLMLQVRNKVVNAYQEVMRMPL